MDNKHYIKLYVGRELTTQEFDEVTDAVEDEFGENIVSDNVLEGKEDNMYCYCFEVAEEIKEGNAALDLLNYEIDQVIPSKINWYIETF